MCSNCFAVQLKTALRKTLVSCARLSRNAKTGIVSLRHHNFDSGEAQFIQSQVTQSLGGSGGSTRSLSRPAHPIAEITKLVDGRKLVKSTAPDKLAVLGKYSELMRRTRSACLVAVLKPAGSVIVVKVWLGPCHPSPDSLS